MMNINIYTLDGITYRLCASCYFLTNLNKPKKVRSLAQRFKIYTSV